MGSGIVCVIPQSSKCPVGCSDCFFQSGRSYLEPLEDNLPNIIQEEYVGSHRVVRVNDENDSNVDRNKVIEDTRKYPLKFFNTSIPKDLGNFPSPVVLTLNPSAMTDHNFHKIKEFPKNLMYVRFRTNMWNLGVLSEAVEYYTVRNKVPLVITFMAYYENSIPEEFSDCYEFKTRIINSYWVIKKEFWKECIKPYEDNELVYTCGKDHKTHSCSRCGNCIREFFNAKERVDPFLEY